MVVGNEKRGKFNERLLIMSWLEASKEGFKSAESENTNFKPYPFSLKEKGDSSVIAHLNTTDTIPEYMIHYHNVYISKSVNEEYDLGLEIYGKGTVLKVRCLAPEGKECPFCEYAKQLSLTDKVKGGMASVRKDRPYSILWWSGKEDKDGIEYPPMRTIRLSNGGDDREIKEHLRQMAQLTEGPLAGQGFEELYLTKYMVTRPQGDKSPKIGKLGSPLGKIDPSDFANIEPLTSEEIEQFFVGEESEILRIAKAFQTENSAVLQ